MKRENAKNKKEKRRGEKGAWRSGMVVVAAGRSGVTGKRKERRCAR